MISDPFAWVDMTFGIHLGPTATKVGLGFKGPEFRVWGLGFWRLGLPRLEFGSKKGLGLSMSSQHAEVAFSGSGLSAPASTSTTTPTYHSYCYCCCYCHCLCLCHCHSTAPAAAAAAATATARRRLLQYCYHTGLLVVSIAIVLIVCSASDLLCMVHLPSIASLASCTTMLTANGSSGPARLSTPLETATRPKRCPCKNPERRNSTVHTEKKGAQNKELQTEADLDPSRTMRRS